MLERIDLYASALPPLSERPVELYVGEPSASLRLRGAKEVLDETVAITPIILGPFSWDNCEVRITPMGEVTALPVHSWFGKDLKDEEIEHAFFDGTLGIYTPQRAEGDHILIEILENPDTPTQTYRRAMIQFKDGRWQFHHFREQIHIPKRNRTR